MLSWASLFDLVLSFLVVPISMAISSSILENPTRRSIPIEWSVLSEVLFTDIKYAVRGAKDELIVVEFVCGDDFTQFEIVRNIANEPMILGLKILWNLVTTNDGSFLFLIVSDRKIGKFRCYYFRCKTFWRSDEKVVNRMIHIFYEMVRSTTSRYGLGHIYGQGAYILLAIRHACRNNTVLGNDFISHHRFTPQHNFWTFTFSNSNNEYGWSKVPRIQRWNWNNP